MSSQKGVKKPRTTEYGEPHAVRFKKKVEKDLAVFSLDRGIRPSSVIQASVECFLSHPKCFAKRHILGNYATEKGQSNARP